MNPNPSEAIQARVAQGDEIRGRILDACRQLVAAGRFPHPAAIAELIPDRHRSTIIKHRRVLFAEGLVDLSPLRPLRRLPRQRTDTLDGETPESRKRIERRMEAAARLIGSGDRRETLAAVAPPPTISRAIEACFESSGFVSYCIAQFASV